MRILGAFHPQMCCSFGRWVTNIDNKLAVEFCTLPEWFRSSGVIVYRFIEEVQREAYRFAVARWLVDEPTGTNGLRQLTADPVVVVSEKFP